MKSKHEIMVLRKIEGKTRLKIFQVDSDTLAKLTKIRGNLYHDDPRLRLVKDLPTPEPEIEISQAAIEATERAVKFRQLMMNAKITNSPRVIEPPEPVLTFDEQIQHDWRYNPGIRHEFISLASYEAYCRAVKDGRCKSYSV